MISYRNDSPNARKPGIRLISTIELLRKQADVRVQYAEAIVDGDKEEARELRLRLAKIGLRLAERIIAV